MAAVLPPRPPAVPVPDCAVVLRPPGSAVPRPEVPGITSPPEAPVCGAEPFTPEGPRLGGVSRSGTPRGVGVGIAAPAAGGQSQRGEHRRRTGSEIRHQRVAVPPLGVEPEAPIDPVLPVLPLPVVPVLPVVEPEPGLAELPMLVEPPEPELLGLEDEPPMPAELELPPEPDELGDDELPPVPAELLVPLPEPPAPADGPEPSLPQAARDRVAAATSAKAVPRVSLEAFIRGSPRGVSGTTVIGQQCCCLRPTLEVHRETPVVCDCRRL